MLFQAVVIFLPILDFLKISCKRGKVHCNMLLHASLLATCGYYLPGYGLLAMRQLATWLLLANLLTLTLNLHQGKNLFKGKWQQNFLSSHLKEALKQYIEVYYRIFISVLIGDLF